MKTIGILGSTGSIGESSLEVIRSFPDRFRVGFLAANRNVELLKKQVDQFRPRSVAVLDESVASHLRKVTDGAVRVEAGENGLLELIEDEDVDVVISSFVGIAGLRPTIRAIEKGKTVALANKESLVVAGELITKLVRKHGTTLLPIDSEHSAIIQCLAGEKPENISRLILTASGGPFLHLPKEEFGNVTVEQALKHPKWKMGNKITIDSATLMNKGLEVIEAHWLFDLPLEKIEVVIHPQSIIHSMVEFVDGSVKAQMSLPDMKLPIQYSLTYPDRMESTYQRIDFSELGTMQFVKPDFHKFECLALAYQALSMGGTAPAILNSANEVAVELFLARKIKFGHISLLIGKALADLPHSVSCDLPTIIEVDRSTQAYVRGLAPHLS